MSKNLYDIIGVPKNASKEEIKKTFRRRTTTEHPDKGGDSDKFKELANAYSILSDDDKRNKYDQTGSTDENTNNFPGDFSDFVGGFQGFPGGFPGFPGGFPGFPGGFQNPPRSPKPMRCNDIVYKFNLSQKEAFFGLNKK
jgi:DnaJ-class molecular chaperone